MLSCRMGQGVCRILLCQWRWPVLWLCLIGIKSLMNYLTYKTKNHWCSVDAHVQNGAGSVSLSLLSTMAASFWILYNTDQISFQLCDLQDQTLLMLRWHVCLEGSSDVDASIFANIGGQYCHSALQRPNLLLITSLTRPQSVVALLPLIFRMGHGASRFVFCLYRPLIPASWKSATNCHSDNPRCMTKYHWRSVDDHLQDGVQSISRLVLIWKAANTSKKDNDVPKSILCI